MAEMKTMKFRVIYAHWHPFQPIVNGKHNFYLLFIQKPLKFRITLNGSERRLLTIGADLTLRTYLNP
jgi:hypothetical protein